MNSDRMLANSHGLYLMGSGKSPSQPLRLVILIPAFLQQIHMVLGTLWMPCSRFLFAMRLTIKQLSRSRVSTDSQVYPVKSD